MEIPSLMMMTLSSLCRRLPPEERPEMRQTLRGTFDEHNYSTIFRVFDQMEYCLHCDNWTTPFMEMMRTAPSQEPYHLIVSHPDLRYRKCCDCQVCEEYNQSHVYTSDNPIGKARLTLCVRCKQSYHQTHPDFYGFGCTIIPFMSTREPFYLVGYHRYSRYYDHIFTLTHRAPSYLIEWTRQKAINRCKLFGGETDHPVREGHALCDKCTGEMLVLGQLRWYNQRHDGQYSFCGGFCEGCQRGSYNIHTIVLKKSDNGWEFGNDHFPNFQDHEWALFQYECKNNLYIRTIYLPKCLGDVPTKYLEHGALICDECFEDIEVTLNIVSSQNEGII